MIGIPPRRVGKPLRDREDVCSQAVGIVLLQRADTRLKIFMSLFDPIFIVNGRYLHPLASHHESLAIHIQSRHLDRLPAHGDLDRMACHGVALSPAWGTAEGGPIRTSAV